LNATAMDFVSELAFPVAEFSSRLARLEALVAAAPADALLIHVPENICYVSGFHTPGYYYPQWIIVAPGQKPLIILRALEALSLPVRSWFGADQLLTFADTQEPIDVLAAALERLGLRSGRLAIEKSGWYFTVAMWEALQAKLPDLQIVDGGLMVERLRKVKSPAEIAHIREACRITEEGMQAAIDQFEVGMTEAALAGEVHKVMTAQGSEYVGLPIFLMSGHRQLAPHSVWSRDKRIVPGENLFLEIAASWQRYCGALFRTFAIGGISDRNRANMDVAVAMLEAAMEAIRPGVTADQVNRAVGKVAEANGVTIRKRCGYSMGLNFAPDWGEGFFLELADDDMTVLEEGMVFHLPETVRRPGEPLVATSETVLVTAHGCEPLTGRFPRGLIRLG
jgi:Xaa-Pro dipeptidase